MKNLKIFFAIACLLTATQTFAQQGNNRRSEFGINAGLNFTHVDIHTPSLTADSKTGYQVGVFYRSGKLFYGQVGLNYQMVRNYYSLADSEGNAKGDFQPHRLQLPLYVGINLVPVLHSVVNVRVYGGPVINYAIHVPSNDLQFTIHDLNRFGMDATVGAGVDILMLSLDAGYAIGLSDVFKENYDAKNNYGFVSLGIRF